MDKIYLKVTAEFNTNGILMPKSFVWEESQVNIDRVLDIMPMGYMKSGGTGERYTCQVEGSQFILYFDGERWYLEK